MDHSPLNSQNLYSPPAIPADSDCLSPDTQTQSQEPVLGPIQIFGAYTLDEFYSACELHQSRKRRLIYGICSFTGLFLGAMVICYILSVLHDHTQIISIKDSFFVGIVVLATFLVIIHLLRWGTARHLKKDFLNNRGLFIVQNIMIDEEGIEYRHEKIVFRVPWNFYGKYRYDANFLVIIYLAANTKTFNIFPRRLFNNQHDWECFIGLLDRKLPRC